MNVPKIRKSTSSTGSDSGIISVAPVNSMNQNQNTMFQSNKTTIHEFSAQLVS